MTKYRVRAYEWMAEIELGGFGNRNAGGMRPMRWLKTKGTEGIQGEGKV